MHIGMTDIKLKWTGWVYHSPASRAEVKVSGVIPVLTLYAFTVGTGPTYFYRRTRGSLCFRTALSRGHHLFLWPKLKENEKCAWNFGVNFEYFPLRCASHCCWHSCGTSLIQTKSSCLNLIARRVFSNNTVIFVFLLLCLCVLIVCLCIFIVPAGTLRLSWPRVFRAFSSAIRQMPGYNPQRRGTARTLSKFLCCSVHYLFYVVLCIVCV
jgi:hypothetical protein